MTPTNSSSSDHDLLIAMNTKLDMALAKLDDHEGRIRSVEKRLYIIVAIGNTLAAAIGMLGGFGLDIFFR